MKNSIQYIKITKTYKIILIFCVICGTKTKTQYCRECVKSPEYDKIRIAKIKSTKLERYGNSNYNNIDKQKETIKEKYNVENISQISEVNKKNTKYQS